MTQHIKTGVRPNMKTNVKLKRKTTDAKEWDNKYEDEKEYFRKGEKNL